MTHPLPDRLAVALARLQASVGHLEALAGRRAEADGARADAAEAFRLLQEDRSRLAVELDGALHRGRALLEANDAVSVRLDQAAATVRAVLAQFEPAEGEPEAEAALDAPARRAGSGRGE